MYGILFEILALILALSDDVEAGMLSLSVGVIFIVREQGLELKLIALGLAILAILFAVLRRVFGWQPRLPFWFR